MLRSFYSKLTFNIKNLTNEIVQIFWYQENIELVEYSECKKVGECPSGLEKSMTCKPYGATKMIFLFCKNRGLNNIEYLKDIEEDIILKIKFNDIKNNLIEIKYPKTELDRWKESTIKLDYLLNQLKRLGIEKNDNYSCIIDLHQDIDIPDISEFDKEKAGIPSALTI